jgi:nucleotide-binding universal stress UspA family protein
MKILIATDGSSHSKAMVKKFSGTAFAPNTEVRIISAYDRSPHTMNIDPVGISNEYYVEVGKELQKTAEDATENAAAALRKKNPKLSISTTVIKGVLKSVVVNEAEKFEADLIGLGSHGHGAIAGFLPGSVSLAVALHAKCAVEIVRIPDRNTIKRKKK